MYITITVLILIICLILALVVLVQNAKGGGLASGFSASNQVMGVRKTTDVLEKMTWGLAIALMIFCVAGTMFMPKTGDNQAVSKIQEQIDNTALPTPGVTPPIGGSQGTPTQGQQPVQNQPTTTSPEQQPPAGAPSK